MEEDMDDADSDNESLDPDARQRILDNLVPGLEPNEYGKMPAAFHTNSQRVAPTTIDTDNIGGGAGSSTANPESNITKPIRKPILPRDKFDGVDSDDETDEEDVEDEEDEEDRPQVVGDVEVDMGEEEEEFLEFSRQALGITDEQWKGILEDRKGRGGKYPRTNYLSRSDVFCRIRPQVQSVSQPNSRRWH
jgi:hypothetical protein